MPDSRCSSLRSALPVVLRTLAVLAALVLSGYGVLFGVAGALSVVRRAGGLLSEAAPWALAFDVAVAYAWIAWLVLAQAWIRQRRVHWWWPVSGTLVGSAFIVMTLGFAIVFTFPAIALAALFVAFQFGATRKTQAQDSSTSRSASTK